MSTTVRGEHDTSALANQYDWIVLGDHPGALLTANLVARLGLSVLMVPKSETRGVLLSNEGQYLDPESNFLLGLGEGGLLNTSLSKVGALSADILAGDRVYPQALTPQYRFQFKSEPNLLSLELNRELGTGENQEKDFIESALASSSEVLDYWSNYPQQLTLDPTGKIKPERRKSWQQIRAVSRVDRSLEARKTSIGTVAEIETVEALRLGFLGLAPVSAGLDSREAFHALALGRSGASFRGGTTSYRKLLLRNAKKLGATILDSADCRRIFVENGRFTGIQVSSSGNMISGSGCILGSSFGQFSERVSVNGRSWFSRTKTFPDPAGWKYTIALSVSDEGIVPGLTRRMIWKEADAPAVEIELAEPGEYGTRDPDRKLIFLRTILPFNTESLNWEFQRMTAARMFRLASMLIPYLEFHVMKVFPDFRSDDQTELKRVYPFERLDMIPENLRCYAPTDHSRKFQGASSGIEGLFISSNQSYPELGSFGPVVAGFDGVAWVAHKMGLSGPLA
jgi:hypothetical protein